MERDLPAVRRAVAGRRTLSASICAILAQTQHRSRSPIMARPNQEDLMLSRRGGYIPGHEIVSALRERQKWIQDEQTQIPANDLTFLVRFVLLGLAAVGLAIWLVGC